jgi:ketosteroid isomerase-like protein
MSENSDALKRGYEAFNNADVETLAALFSHDIRWEGPNTEGVPMSGVHVGKEDVLSALAGIGLMFDSFHVSPDEMIEQGETIVVLSHVDAKTQSGQELKLPGVEVWRMTDGVAHRVQSLLDTAEVKAAIGS